MAGDIFGDLDASVSWRDLEWIAGYGLPVVIKGVLTAEDARLAVEHGAAGVVVLESRRAAARRRAGVDRRARGESLRPSGTARMGCSTAAYAAASTSCAPLRSARGLCWTGRAPIPGGALRRAEKKVSTERAAPPARGGRARASRCSGVRSIRPRSTRAHVRRGDVERLILARHGESVFSERLLVNGDVAVPGPLTASGVKRRPAHSGRALRGPRTSTSAWTTSSRGRGGPPTSRWRGGRSEARRRQVQRPALRRLRGRPRSSRTARGPRRSHVEQHAEPGDGESRVADRATGTFAGYRTAAGAAGAVGDRGCCTRCRSRTCSPRTRARSTRPRASRSSGLRDGLPTFTSRAAGGGRRPGLAAWSGVADVVKRLPLAPRHSVARPAGWRSRPRRTSSAAGLRRRGCKGRVRGQTPAVARRDGEGATFAAAWRNGRRWGRRGLSGEGRHAPQTARAREPRPSLQNGAMDGGALCERVERHIRAARCLITAGASEILCLVSGGADSTCLWHVLRRLGYRVSALHVNHGLRRADSDADADFCRDVPRCRGRARVPPASTEAELRPAALCRTPPTGSAPPAIRPPTRSRRSSTASYRAARRAGSRLQPRGGIVRPLLDRQARGDERRTARAIGLEQPPRTRRTATPRAG